MKYFIALQCVLHLSLGAGYWGSYGGPVWSSMSPYYRPSIQSYAPYAGPPLSYNQGSYSTSCPSCVPSQNPVCGLNTYNDDFKTFQSLCFMQLNNCYNSSYVYEMQHYGVCRTPPPVCTCPTPTQCQPVQICLPCSYCPPFIPGPVPTAKTAPGYQFVSGFGNYKFHPAALSWLDAYEACWKESAYLVVFNSEAENAAVLSIFKANQGSITGATFNTYAWVGYVESAWKDGLYFTVGGDKLDRCVGFKRWNGPEPNSPSVGDYGWMHVADGGLGDEGHATGTKLAFICELI